MLVDELRQPQRTRHARRTSADDNDIGLHLRSFNAFDRFAKVNHACAIRLLAEVAIRKLWCRVGDNGCFRRGPIFIKPA